jgi:hypothetical protein
VSSKQNTANDLLKRARETRASADAIDDVWMKELMVHIAEEYERAAERITLLGSESAAGHPALEKTSLFSI